MLTAKKTFVFILGAHRSGTSALARFMSSMGVWLGSDLIEAKAGINDEGFWEHQGIVSLNDRILACFGSSWHDIRPLPDNWLDSPAISALREEARQLVASSFGDRVLAGAKDPRFCRLLPFWSSIVRELGWTPVAINGYRSIVNASKSLVKRDGFPEVLCQLIWLINNTEMELNTRDMKTAFVEYDYFLESPERMASNLATYFSGIPFQLPADPAVGINKALRHHVTKGDVLTLDLSPLELLGEEVSDNFRAARSPEIKARMDHIRASVASIASASPMLAALTMNLSRDFIRSNSKMIELGAMHSHAQTIVQQRDQQIRITTQANQELQKERDTVNDENARLRAEVDALRMRLSDALSESSVATLELAKTKHHDLSAQEKKLSDLQATIEKRSAELRMSLAKIRDLQLGLIAYEDKIDALSSEISRKESLIKASEVIINDQAGLVDSGLRDLDESRHFVASLKQDLSSVTNKLHDAIKRNLATLDVLAVKEKALLQVRGELSSDRRRLAAMEKDKKFWIEKELYLDRMLLQLTSELEDVNRVVGEKERYLEKLELDVGQLNAQISALHNEIVERDKLILELQEKFFYLRVRFLSRLLIKLGLYKVPHE